MLGKIILEALRLDVSNPDLTKLAQLEQRIASHNNYIFSKPAPSSGTITISPQIKHSLMFSHLRPGEVYSIKVYWEKGLGLRVYLIHGTHTVCYDPSTYNQSTAKYVQAAVKVRAVDDLNLEQARLTQKVEFTESIKLTREAQVERKSKWRYDRRRNDALGSIIKLAATLDKNAPDAKEFKIFLDQISAFNDNKYMLKTTRGIKRPEGITFFRYTMKVDDLYYCFQYLEPRHAYTIRTFWKPGLGLYVDFVGQHESIAYRVNFMADDVYTLRYPILIARSASSADVQKTILEEENNTLRNNALASIINLASTLDENFPEALKLEKLQQEMEIFNKNNKFLLKTGRGKKIENGRAFDYRIKLSERQFYIFHHLNPEQTIRLKVLWKKGIGLCVEFQDSLGVIIYQAKATRNSHFAKIKARASNMREAWEYFDADIRRHGAKGGVDIIHPIDPHDFRFEQVTAQEDTLNNVLANEREEIFNNILSKRKYPSQQERWFKQIYKLIDDGYTFEEALHESGVTPPERYGWVRSQWPEIMKDLENFIKEDFAKAASFAMTTPKAVQVGRNKGPGGIDLTSDKVYQIRNDGHGEIKFHLNPAIVAQLQNSPGFTVGTIKFHPLTNLRTFLNHS